jgi:hypothetical protein
VKSLAAAKQEISAEVCGPSMFQSFKAIHELDEPMRTVCRLNSVTHSWSRFLWVRNTGCPAGLLVNSMAAANQEISAELQGLAMKDSRYSKGQTRSKGGAANPSGGGKRRVSSLISSPLERPLREPVIQKTGGAGRREGGGLCSTHVCRRSGCARLD